MQKQLPADEESLAEDVGGGGKRCRIVWSSDLLGLAEALTWTREAKKGDLRPETKTTSLPSSV